MAGTQRHMWVEFFTGSHPCSKIIIFSGYFNFPLSSKIKISKFQFDPESVPNEHSVLNILTLE